MTPRPPDRRSQLKIRATGVLLAFAFLTLAALQPPSAVAQATPQKIVTTIIPGDINNEALVPPAGFKTVSGKPATLKFSMNEVPAGATIVKATLQLVCKAMPQGGATATVQVKLPNAELRDATFYGGAPGIDKPKEWLLDPVDRSWKAVRNTHATFDLTVESTIDDDDRVLVFAGRGEPQQSQATSNPRVHDGQAGRRADGGLAVHAQPTPVFGQDRLDAVVEGHCPRREDQRRPVVSARILPRPGS